MNMFTYLVSMTICLICGAMVAQEQVQTKEQQVPVVQKQQVTASPTTKEEPAKTEDAKTDLSSEEDDFQEWLKGLEMSEEEKAQLLKELKEDEPAVEQTKEAEVSVQSQSVAQEPVVENITEKIAEKLQVQPEPVHVDETKSVVDHQ